MYSDPSLGSAVAGANANEQSKPRRFGRSQSACEAGLPSAAAGGPERLVDGADGGAVLPFDSTKTFVGPNGTYYDERWRWMEWRGRLQNWNWAAVLSCGVWFAYRRLYGWAVLAFGWLMAVLGMALTGANLRLLGIGYLIVAVAAGRYGNMLYRQRFRRLASRVARNQKDHDERVRELRRRGGVDRPAAWSMVLAIIVGALGMAWQIRRTVGLEVDW